MAKQLDSRMVNVIPSVTNYLSTNNIILCSVRLGSDYYNYDYPPALTGSYGMIEISPDATNNSITQSIANFPYDNLIASTAKHISQFDYVNDIPVVKNFINDSGVITEYLNFINIPPRTLTLGSFDVDVNIGRNLSAVKTVFASGGNSNQWNQAYNVATTYQSTSGSFITTNYLSSNNVLLSSATISNTLSISSVQFTGETKTSTTSITATDLYIKVVVGNQTKYLRLFDVI